MADEVFAALDEFLAGAKPLASVQSVIREALARDPQLAVAVLAKLDGLLRSGRLLPQLHQMLVTAAGRDTSVDVDATRAQGHSEAGPLEHARGGEPPTR